MQQAIDRVIKTLNDYTGHRLSRSVATIELVSAFKVVCKPSEGDAEKLQTLVAGYIEAILIRLDDGALSLEEAIAELSRVYEAASQKDPDIMRYIGHFE